MKAINGYSDGDDIVFVCRDEFGKKLHRIKDFSWYFYVDWSFYDALKSDKYFSESFKEQNSVTQIKTEEPFIRIHTSYSSVYQKRSSVMNCLRSMGKKTYEADVDPLKRYMIDCNDVEVSDEYKVLYFDIETDDRPKPGSLSNEIIIGDRQIISISGFCTPNDNFTSQSFDEVECLRGFFKRVKDYDVLIGWNSDAFDRPYIEERVAYIKRRYGIDLMLEFDIDWDHFIFVDLMWRFKHVYQHDTTLSSFSLKRVSERFEVGTKTDLRGRSIWDTFVEDPELGKKYNMNDCRLLYELEQKLGIFKQMVAQARFCKTFLSRFWITELLDNLILQSGKARHIHLPTKEWTTKTDDSYAGGYVLEPKPGFYNNINIFDYQSLYPNIIRTWNISPDRMFYEGGSEYIRSAKPGVFFSKQLTDANNPDSYFGLLPGVVKDLLDERDRIKVKKAVLVNDGKRDSLEYQTLDRNEKIVKELGNSAYGIAGSPRSRYYSIDLAESITLGGQHLIKYARDFFEGLGFVVCAGDTDSIMVSLPEGSDPKSIMDKYHEALKLHVTSTFQANECFIKFKHEKKFSRFINIKKKNYVGLVIEEGGKKVDYVYAKGLELIKKDTISYTRALLKQLLDWLLYEDHDKDFYIQFIEKLREEIHTRQFKVEEICVTQRISKDFDSYKTKPSHVRLAERMWSSGDKEFFIGMDIQFFIIDSTDKENKAAHISSFTGIFDKQFYWEHKIAPPLIRILEVVFKDVDWSNYEDSSIKRPKKPRKKKVKIIEDPIASAVKKSEEKQKELPWESKEGEERPTEMVSEWLSEGPEGIGLEEASHDS